MSVWMWWTLLAILLFAGEIFTSGFFLMWLGVAALVGAGLAALGLGPPWQLLGFVASSAGLIFSTRRLAKRFLGVRERPPLATNVDALINATGVVIKRIDNDQGGGLVRVGGEEWTALSEDDVPIPEGKRVLVLRVEGVKLIVSEQP